MIVTFAGLKQIREKYRSQKIVLGGGVFDKCFLSYRVGKVVEKMQLMSCVCLSKDLAAVSVRGLNFSGIRIFRWIWLAC